MDGENMGELKTLFNSEASGRGMVLEPRGTNSRRPRWGQLSDQQELLHTERLATIGRMASMISHDLRHPLCAILAYAEFLSEGNLDQQHRKDLYEEIRLAVNRMTEQLSSLLAFSQETDAVRAVQGDVSEVLRRAVRLVQARPEFRDIAIKVSSESRCQWWFDHGKLERVLLNLLLNACEAVPRDSGRIEVRIQTFPAGLQIRIADNGTGIPSEIRDTLFQPFVSHGKENGFGLGLAIAQKIVQNHGGEIVVERTGPRGTVFLLKLPSAGPAYKAAGS
jgi:signal transduction histidine kinase